MRIHEVYQAYYTKSVSLVSYMVNMLSVQPGMRVLEPSAGDGVFIDALIAKIPNLQLDAYELDTTAVALLQEKYLNQYNISIKQADTLLDEKLTFYSQMGGIYDRVIGNPPYGGWQDYNKRKNLKKKYPKIYVKETYAVFLYRCINLLVEGGRLVFITPDTFLNLHMHRGMREYLLTNTRIKEIALFPSSFFPNVNFGYSKLLIITLEKSHSREDCLNNSFRLLSGFSRVQELESSEGWTKVSTFTQKDIYDHPDHAFFVSNDVVNTLINSSLLKIGDIADCVTGIYSGNDKKYLRPISSSVKNSNKYLLLNKDLICSDYLQEPDILNGINAAACFIPIIKGGATRYLKQDVWYIDWSREAVRDYKTNKKARFQNSPYYFKSGIAIPMVSSTQVTASLMENRIFDQSIVGVFPHDANLVRYLLAFFNSPTCNKLLRTINPSANNSANYIKKIPFLMPGEEILRAVNLEIDELLRELRNDGKYEREHELKTWEIINQLYGF